MKVSRFLKAIGNNVADGEEGVPGTSAAANPARVPKKYQDTFTSEEWRTLQLGPIWVMGDIAHADGEMDDHEKQAFFETFHESPLLRGALARDVFMSAFTDLQDVMEAFKSDDRSTQQALATIAAVLDHKADADEAVMYKYSLIGVGAQIAEASGTRLAPNFSPEERLALSWMASWLEFDWEETEATAERYGTQGGSSDPDLPGQYL